jgi:hypothetical protein
VVWREIGQFKTAKCPLNGHLAFLYSFKILKNTGINIFLGFLKSGVVCSPKILMKKVAPRILWFWRIANFLTTVGG